MEEQKNRLTILSQSEIQDYFGTPKFTQKDREHFFNLNVAELQLLLDTRGINTRIHFVLQIGYFKAKLMFFNYEGSEVANDVTYIVSHYYPEIANHELAPLSKQTKVSQQQAISQYFDYRRFSRDIRQSMVTVAARTVRRSAKPVFILRELLSYLEKERIISPAYSSFQDLIGSCIAEERRRINQLLRTNLQPDVETALAKMLDDDRVGLYLLTKLKKEPRDFGYKEIGSEVNRSRLLKPLYDFGSGWLPKVEISAESIRYYAALVEYYSIYKLRRFEKMTAYFYLLCYAYHRTHLINDNLIDALINNVRHYEQKAKQSARELIAQKVAEARDNLKLTGQVLAFFINPEVDDSLPFGEIRNQAFQVMDKEQMANISAFVASTGFDEDEYQWQHLEALSATIKKNIRQIVKAIDFKAHSGNANLLQAITFLQDIFEKGKILRQIARELFPTDFIGKSLKKYVFMGKGIERLNAERYEFAVYKMLRNAFESGDIYNGRTTKYRSFTDDLIPAERWARDKSKILSDLSPPVLNAPITDTLQTFKEQLEKKFIDVNQRIINQDNKGLKITGEGKNIKWTLPYRRGEEEENHALYQSVTTIDIASLLAYVNQRTHFLSGFTHILDRHIKNDKDEKTLLACIVSLGTNMNLGRMAEISDISYQELKTNDRNFLRLETLKESNDLIANATAKLPIFKHYNIEDDILHSSSDGQRNEAQWHTFNSRYSSKYFGLKKGISTITLIGNHVPLNARVIGTHEHESHYVFDLLYNNTTEIDPNRHSTDTHGVNQVNFWILHAYGYQFAPRYKNFTSRTEGIIGFHQPSYYNDDYLIKPCRKVNEELIVSEWDNILHIMASLGQKETSQVAIVRKLSSYARKNRTKKALWELDNICKSIYMLDYIDDESLRRHVTKALNRGEAYHRLKKAIAHVNGGRMKVKSEAEQHIIHECTRLMANAVIYFNAELLSSMLDKLDSIPDDLREQIKKVSPVAWQHINFYGRFKFSELQINVELDRFTETPNVEMLKELLSR